MKLATIRVEHREFVGRLIGAALRLANEGERCWIICHPGGDIRVLATEVEGGDFDPPECCGVLGVATEEAHFDCIEVGVKLGPGVWPL